jgi:hypothetical protein
MSGNARAAAEALKSAIDEHLAACETRAGEQDETVEAAYGRLREAAESYDDALFDEYDEVTPFEFSAGPIWEAAEVTDARLPPRLSVLVRRDFTVQSPEDLLAAALATSPEGDEPAESQGPIDALGTLLDRSGIDALTWAGDTGLRYLGGTVWVLVRDVDDDTLDPAPFVAVDESRLLLRLDEKVVG